MDILSFARRGKCTKKGNFLMFSVLLLLIIPLIFGLVGCEPEVAEPPPEEEPEPATDPEEPEPEEDPDWPSLIGFTTTGEGHGSYPIVIAANSLITEHVEGVTAREIVVESPPAGIRRLGAGEVDFVHSPSGITHLTNRGMGDFEQIPLNLMFTGGRVFQHFIVLEDSGIESFGDLEGKTVVAEMPPAPGHIASFLGAVEAYGLTEDDMTILAGLSFSEMIGPVIEGMADGVHLAGMAPISAGIELETTRDVKFIGIDEERMPDALEGAAERGWFFQHLVMPAGTYDSQDEDLNVTGSYDSYGVNPNIDPDLVYEIMKAIFDHEEEFKAMQPPGVEKIGLDEALLDDDTTPYHPGAIRYYREQGLWTEEHDAMQEELLEELGLEFAPHGFEPIN